MRKIKNYLNIFFPLLVAALFLFPALSFSEEKIAGYPVRSGVFIELTEDFYRALREESDRGSRTYSTDQSDEYLRQISVSAKFMVETNLHILKQQDTIIRLLESLNSKRK